MQQMRMFLLAVALVSFIGVIPARNARADLPVIDVVAIADAVKAYAVQLQQLATEIKTWVTENLSWLTELKELEEDIQMVANLTMMVMMVENFIHYPALGTATGLMNMAGLDLSLPVDPYAVQNLLTGYSGVHSITGLTGKLGSLSSLIPGSYDRDHLYSCTDDSFACAQSQRRANAYAGYKGTLSNLYSDLVDHNPVLDGLRTDMNAKDPKTVLDATGQATLENAWATEHLAQIQTVNGLAQAQQWIDQQQGDEKLRMDSDAFLAAMPK
jgi:hypothetical protein